MIDTGVLYPVCEWKGNNDILLAMVHRKTFTPSDEEIKRACKLPLHPDAETGIELYNREEYFLAHEYLEDAWNHEGEPERRLYQGILQAAVLCMHALNRNYRGVFSMYARTQVWLAPWPNHCRGLDIGQLRSDIDALVAEVERLGSEGMDQIEKRFFSKIRFLNQIGAKNGN
jgi:predicted metal-dependent hydrolase